VHGVFPHLPCCQALTLLVLVRAPVLDLDSRRLGADAGVLTVWFGSTATRVRRQKGPAQLQAEMLLVDMLTSRPGPRGRSADAKAMRPPCTARPSAPRR